VELPMFVCKHCHGDVIILNRRQDTVWCSKCDSYICDNCAIRIAAGEPHKTAQEFLIEAFEMNNRPAKFLLP